MHAPLFTEIPVCFFPSELHGDQVDKTEIKMKLEEDKMHSTQEVLFDFIAQSLADFIKDNNIAPGLPLGVTFCFPTDQTSLSSGILIRWTKGFTASGAVGRDVIEMLKDAFTRRGGVSLLRARITAHSIQLWLTHFAVTEPHI